MSKTSIQYRALSCMLENKARLTPQAVALLTSDGARLTYRELWFTVRNLAQRLAAKGLADQVIAVVAQEGLQLAQAVLGVTAVGQGAPLNPTYRKPEYERYLRLLQPKAVLLDDRPPEPLLEAAALLNIPVLGLTELLLPAQDRQHPAENFSHPELEQTALLLTTSGTLSDPKIVPLTHHNLLFATQNICEVLELNIQDRCLAVMPLFHIHGLSTLLASMMSGSSFVCLGRFAEGPSLEALRSLKATWYSASPMIHRAILDALVNSPETFSIHTLRFIRSASSPMPPELAVALQKHLGIPVIEAYGMTEAAPQIASNRLPPWPAKPGSVGQAAGPEIRIQDDSGNLLESGRIGEILVRGENITPTCESWLATGDLGYLDEEGYLFVTGRRKEMINRGGEKIAPREVEDVLQSHPFVETAAVFALPHPILGEHVGAAVVLRPQTELKEFELRQFAAGQLADFKLPQRLEFVSELPQGPSGKLQRRRLTEHFSSTPTEQRILNIWREILDHEAIRAQDNFFLLGGHSLAASRVLMRFEQEFARTLTLEEFFQNPTAEEQASLLGQTDDHTVSTPNLQGTEVTERPGDDAYPMTSAQQRLWFVDSLEQGNPAYHMGCLWEFSGTLDVTALEQALEVVCSRHNSLRSFFPMIGSHPVQRIHEPETVLIPVFNLSRFGPEQVESKAAELVQRKLRETIRVTEFPLFRAYLLRLGPQQHRLLLVAHHIIFDGWSRSLLQDELGKLYSHILRGQKAKLPPPPQFTDYARWQKERLQEPKAQRSLDYWKGQFESLPKTLELPIDRPRPPLQTYRGEESRFSIPSDLVSKLRSLGSTLFEVTLGAFAILLARLSGQSDLVVGVPIANRNTPEAERVIGLFANTLPLRIKLEGDLSFLEFLSQVREVSLNAQEHREFPLEKLISELGLQRDPSRPTLFQAVLAFQNLPQKDEWSLSPEVRARALPLEASVAKFDLTLYLHPSGEQLKATWQYNRDLFNRSTVEAFTESFLQLLEALAEHPRECLSRVPLEREFHRPAGVLRGRQTPAHRELSIIQQFHQIARNAPDAPAVVCNTDEWTYGELQRKVLVLSEQLQATGISKGDVVAVLADRGVTTIAATLAIWQIGATFLPLDPAHPPNRLQFCLEDSQAKVVLTQSNLEHRCPETLPRLLLQDDTESINQIPEPTQIDGGLDTLAYIVYTSGSTGRPKGVRITQANLAHYADALNAALNIQSTDRYLQSAAPAFSSALRQLTLPLVNGAALVVAGSEQLRDPESLMDLLRETEATIMDLVPTHWIACSEALDGLCSPPGQVRLLLSASEPLASDLPPKALRVFGQPEARFINMYGQTETTGIVATHTVHPAESYGAHVPIGRPIARTEIHLLDFHQKPVSLGTIGEVYIAGSGVGAGYLKREREEQTSPFLDGLLAPNQRLYRTGDLASQRPDGELEYRGRVDNQIKIRGYRVEPGEIESVLRLHNAVKNAVVVPSGQRLVAFLQGEIKPSDLTQLKSHCRDVLPEHMVPSRFVVLSEFPRTATGKLDRTDLVQGLSSESTNPEVETPSLSLTKPEAIRRLTGVWQAALEIESVSPQENFFDLGGNSIVSVEVMLKATQVGVPFTLKQLFQYQSIEELADVICGSAPEDRPQDLIRVEVSQLRTWGRRLLEEAGLSPEGAAVLTEVQLESSLRGQPTHHLGDLPRYARRLQKNILNPRPKIEVNEVSDILAVVDGDNGPGQWIATMAMETAIKKAKLSGFSLVTVRRSNHFGAAGHYAWLAAKENLIGICTTNGPLILAPTGGVTPTFGNNPIAASIPAGKFDPILLDIALSVAPRGKIGFQLARGETLPAGWILDRHGKPSTDLTDLAAGLGIPIGDHKGYGLAMVMEVLAGVLSGAGFGLDHQRGKHPLDLGHFFLVLDPSRFLPLQEFKDRVDRLIEQAKGSVLAQGSQEILYPGEMEWRARRENFKRGVPVTQALIQALRAPSETTEADDS
jgi:amino acid adenylation domain-containing protein